MFLQNVTALLKGEDQNTTTFRPLHRGAEYCVSARVQGQASQSVSTVSPKQCVLLPERGKRLKMESLNLGEMGLCLQLCLMLVLLLVPPRVVHNCCDIPLNAGRASLRLHHRSHPLLLPETTRENSRCFGENRDPGRRRKKENMRIV